MLYYGFILQDGTTLTMDEKNRLHSDVALKYIKEEYLMKDYRKSPYSDPVDFLVLELGAMKVGNMATSTTVTISRSWLTPKMNEFVKMYRREGYRIDYI